MAGTGAKSDETRPIACLSAYIGSGGHYRMTLSALDTQFVLGNLKKTGQHICQIYYGSNAVKKGSVSFSGVNGFQTETKSYHA